MTPTRKPKKCPVKEGGCGWLMKHLGSGRYTCTNPECPVEMDNNGTITYKPVTPPLPFAQEKTENEEHREGIDSPKGKTTPKICVEYY